MTKIFKQLARHWAVCLAVFALLFVQAYCDLSLPDYTSKIVDTGIQQGGIESPLPQTVRKSTLDALSLLMNEEDAQKLQSAYQYYLQDDGVLQLRSDLTADERTALEDSITTPDIVLYLAAAQAANAPAGQHRIGYGYRDRDRSPHGRRPRHRVRPVCRYEPDARLQPRRHPAAADRCHRPAGRDGRGKHEEPVSASGAAGI